MLKSKKNLDNNFIIISKSPKGNKQNTKYNVVFQKQGSFERYNVEMIYLKIGGKCRWAFIENKDLVATNNILKTKSDRDRFIEELIKFQTGGVYRKTHPIQYNQVESLENERNNKLDEVGELSHQLDELKAKLMKDAADKYREMIKNANIDNFRKSLDKFMSSQKCTFGFCKDIVVKDTQTGLPICKIQKNKNSIKVCELSNDDIFNALVFNTYTKEYLKEYCMKKGYEVKDVIDSIF